MYGQGDLELNHNILHLRCTQKNRQKKTEKQKNAILQKFINHGLEKPNLKYIESTDGKLVLPTTATMARKPGQKKRCKSAKTITTKE